MISVIISENQTVWTLILVIADQGRRRLFECGTAIERRPRSPSVEGTSGGRAGEGVRSPSR